MRLPTLVCALLAAPLLLSGCSLATVSGGDEIRIVADEHGDGMSFEPSEITVAPGTKVTFVIKNEGSVDHEFESIEAGEAGIDEIFIPAGRTRRVNWTAPSEAATFKVYCDLPGHRAAGMEITLKVAPASDAP
jgi:uncharacterized cupredoxin-like copper-binding protein